MAHKLPQAFDRVTSVRFYLTFLAALTPVAAAAVWSHGWYALLLIFLSMASAQLSDEALRKLRRVHGPRDWSGLLWGLLLALLLPADAPFHLPVIGSAFAVFICKGLLGGGTPWINPVLAAWAFLQAGWPKAFAPLTPLSTDGRTVLDQQGVDWLNTNLFSWLSIQLPPGYLDLFLGLGRPASSLLVESGPLFLLAATVILLAQGYIPWRVPAVFFAACTLPMVLVGGNVLYHVFAGGLLLNLFFLATDTSCRPLGKTGLVVYAAGAGLFTFLIRIWGLGPDGVGYAVLLMNLFVPWIDSAWRRKTLHDFRVA